jgi:hypothetical protein
MLLDAAGASRRDVSMLRYLGDMEWRQHVRGESRVASVNTVSHGGQGDPEVFMFPDGGMDHNAAPRIAYLLPFVAEGPKGGGPFGQTFRRLFNVTGYNPRRAGADQWGATSGVIRDMALMGGARDTAVPSDAEWRAIVRAAQQTLARQVLCMPPSTTMAHVGAEDVSTYNYTVPANYIAAAVGEIEVPGHVSGASGAADVMVTVSPKDPTVLLASTAPGRSVRTSVKAKVLRAAEKLVSKGVVSVTSEQELRVSHGAGVPLHGLRVPLVPQFVRAVLRDGDWYVVDRDTPDIARRWDDVRRVRVSLPHGPLQAPGTHSVSAAAMAAVLVRARVHDRDVLGVTKRMMALIAYDRVIHIPSPTKHAKGHATARFTGGAYRALCVLTELFPTALQESACAQDGFSFSTSVIAMRVLREGIAALHAARA